MIFIKIEKPIIPQPSIFLTLKKPINSQPMIFSKSECQPIKKKSQPIKKKTYVVPHTLPTIIHIQVETVCNKFGKQTIGSIFSI